MSDLIRPDPTDRVVVYHGRYGGGDDVAEEFYRCDGLGFTLGREGEAEMSDFV